jgi:hypothetical protein
MKKGETQTKEGYILYTLVLSILLSFKNLGPNQDCSFLRTVVVMVFTR